MENISIPEDLPPLSDLGAPNIDLEVLKNTKKTQDLLIKVGLL